MSNPILRRLAGAAATAALAVLAACGGGGYSSAGVGTGGTGSFAIGPISGFGSIVVNGVHYDDSKATVYDDDGSLGSRDDLGLGMVVEVRGAVGSDGVSGTASSFVHVSEITALDVAGGSFSVFGQAVRVNAATVFADVAGLSALAVGNVVEVYALRDASGELVATRIEREALDVASFSGEFRVRGALSGLTGTSPSLRFTVATVAITTDATTRIDGTIAEGVFVSVRLNKTAAGDGSYAATRVQVKSRGFDNSVDEAELKGFVAGFTAADQPFTVGGYPVRLGSSVRYDDGTLADLANGVLVEANGTVSAGVLLIQRLEFEDEDSSGGDDGNDAPFEFKGAASCTPAPCTATEGSFTVQGVAIRYDASTRFDNGVTTANLNGMNVEVKAVAQNSAGGTSFLATRIEPDR